MDWQVIVKANNVQMLREMHVSIPSLKKILVLGYEHNKVDVINFAFASLGGWPKLLTETNSKLLVQCFLSMKMSKEYETVYHGFMNSIKINSHFNPEIALEVTSAIMVFLCNTSKKHDSYAFELFCFYIKCLGIDPTKTLLKNSVLFEMGLLYAIKSNYLHVVRFLIEDAHMVFPRLEYLRKSALEAGALDVVRYFDQNFFSYTPLELSAVSALMSLRHSDNVGFF